MPLLNRPRLSIAQVLICGGLIVSLSMGIRHGFGLWLQPITQAHAWTRESFAFAIAIQNLAWGLIGVFAGMAADRFGATRVLLLGSLLYALGLAGMALSPTPVLFVLTTGVLLGAAQAGTTYAVIFGVIGRQLAQDKRSWAMGLAAAAGSFGQFLMVPLEGLMISSVGWQRALLLLAGLALLIIPLGFGLREPSQNTALAAGRQPLGQAVKEAFGCPSFLLLTAGYFVCGFQVVFIGVHMPAYLRDKGMSPQLASYALALIGLFNIVGTYVAGSLGQRMAKRKILAAIYLARALVIAVFVWLPVTPLSVCAFAAAMGLLWLSTVPVTNAAVAQIFGVAHFSMLSGFVFLSHQVGSFLGVWLGGVLYDRTGSYDIVWQIAIGLSLVAVGLNLPVREVPIRREPTLRGA